MHRRGWRFHPAQVISSSRSHRIALGRLFFCAKTMPLGIVPCGTPPLTVGGLSSFRSAAHHLSQILYNVWIKKFSFRLFEAAFLQTFFVFRQIVFWILSSIPLLFHISLNLCLHHPNILKLLQQTG